MDNTNEEKKSEEEVLVDSVESTEVVSEELENSATSSEESIEVEVEGTE